MMQSLIRFLTILRSSSLRKTVSLTVPHTPQLSRNGPWVWGLWVLILPVTGCTLGNGWEDWIDDEPSYTRLESDIIAAPEPGQPVPVQHPSDGVVAPPVYAARVPESPPGYGYYPPQPPPSYYSTAPSLGISPSGCPVPGQYGRPGWPQSYPLYPVQPPPAYVPPYSPQGYYPGSAVPGPSSSRLTVSPGTQVNQDAASEQELVRRYQILNNCTNVGGNAEIGFYCDDYE